MPSPLDAGSTIVALMAIFITSVQTIRFEAYYNSGRNKNQSFQNGNES